MEDEEFEKYYDRISDCMYDCEIIKAERRTKLKQILEEIESNAIKDILKERKDLDEDTWFNRSLG